MAPRAMNKAADAVGQTFGRLTVIAVSDERDACRRIKVRCHCECGTEILAVPSHLRSGHTRSCGCVQRDWACSGDARGGSSRVVDHPTPRGSRESGGPLDDCIEWWGSKNGNGYGQIRVKGRYVGLAHRAAYEAEHGPIPDGMCVCHRCDNPPCVNVDHLWLGTQGENVLDMVSKGRHAAGRGPSNARKKLRVEDVHAIRARLATGERQWSIAASYGVTAQTISTIGTGKNWAGL